MTTEPTRKQYMNKEVSFSDFYRAVYQTAGISLGANESLVLKVKTALSEGDEHLNSIPLGYWDGLAFSARGSLKKAFKKHGDFYSMAGGVCAMKQAARDAAERTTRTLTLPSS